MWITVSVAGGADREVEVAAGGGDGAETTYADLIEAVGLSAREATALVDGRPVPEDAPVEAERVEVVRLIQGG